MRTPASSSLVFVLAALGALGAACADGTTAASSGTSSSSNDGGGGAGEGGNGPATTTGSTTTTSSVTTATSSSSGGQGGEGGSGQGGDGGQGGADLCGNGQVDGDEICDGAALADQTCEDLAFVGGALGCSDDCTAFDTSACETCGDDAVSGADACDGADLDGEDCSDQGFDGGTLGCNDDCTFDVSACVDATCEDGILNGNEDCTGDDLDGETCATQGFLVGGTLACTSTCQFDTSACLSCGDGVINGNDACDGAELGNATCATAGFTGGTLGCAACVLDTTACTNFAQPTVGEVVFSEIMYDPSTVDPLGEWVEIHNPGLATYQLNGCVLSDNSASFTIEQDLTIEPGGYVTLARANTDTFVPDVFYTTAGIQLGNGGDVLTLTCGAGEVDVVDYGADGFADPVAMSLQLDPGSSDATANDIGTNWCAATTNVGLTVDLGTPGSANTVCAAGTTSSSSATTGSTTGTTTGGGEVCGDAAVTGAEVCDGAQLGTETCETQGFLSGTLACAGDCLSYDTSACVDSCGDDMVNGTDECDGADLDGAACGDFGFQGGTLSCSAECTYVLTACTGGVGLIISEYIERSTGNNKAIEIANIGNAPFDLSVCELRVWSNGNAAPGASLPLVGTLAAGDAYAVCNSQETDFLDSLCDLRVNVNAVAFSGNDSIELLCNGLTVDVFGQFGGNMVWGTNPENSDESVLRRECSVAAGDTNGTDPFDPAAEWIGIDYDPTTADDDLGSYVCPP